MTIKKSIKLILTKGLPASGKTTWAKELLQQKPDYVNLCKDDLRLMFSSSKKREREVLEMRNYLTKFYLQNDKNVIWSDTNLNPIHEQKAQEICNELINNGLKVELEIKDFRNVDYKECIKRDLLRSNSVGESVIKEMYYQYIYNPLNTPVYDNNLPDCYLCDIDGTVAIMNDRKPFDWEKVYKDKPNLPVIKVIQTLSQNKNNKIIFLSGRDDICKQMTKEWINKYIGFAIEDITIYMRKNQDMRGDETVKAEIYNQEIYNKYNVLGIFDDRPKVCRMWRQLSLTLFQIGNPEIEF
jgi:predicted kinase